MACSSRHGKFVLHVVEVGEGVGVVLEVGVEAGVDGQSRPDEVSSDGGT